MTKRRYTFTISFETSNWQDAADTRASISALGRVHFMGLTCGPLMVECDTRPDSEVSPSGEAPAFGFKPIPINLEAKKLYPDYHFAKWDGQPKRAPKKGDLFISGAIPVAYATEQEFSTMYFIAVPTKEMP